MQKRAGMQISGARTVIFAADFAAESVAFFAAVNHTIFEISFFSR